jgi:hypothetical protein
MMHHFLLAMASSRQVIHVGQTAAPSSSSDSQEAKKPAGNSIQAQLATSKKAVIKPILSQLSNPPTGNT